MDVDEPVFATSLRHHLEHEQWMLAIEEEIEWLVSTRKMPPRESGLYSDEAARLGIYPLYDLKTAAKTIEVDAWDLYDAIQDGRLQAISAYEMALIRVSSLYPYAQSHPTATPLPAGGDWDEVDELERRRIRAHRLQRITTVLCVDPATLSAALQEFDADIRRADERQAASRSAR